MLRRTPFSCSGWPVACTDGGVVRIGLPDWDNVLLVPSPAGRGWRAAPGEGTGLAEPSPPVPLPEGEGRAAVPAAAAFFTSCIVTTPPAPVAWTRARSTLSFLAIARTAGTALTPPTLPACSVRTSLLLETAPTTVPSSSRSAVPPFLISPPSSDAITLSPLAGAGAPAPFSGCAGA